MKAGCFEIGDQPDGWSMGFLREFRKGDRMKKSLPQLSSWKLWQPTNP
jgi:hypothetical protein